MRHISQVFQVIFYDFRNQGEIINVEVNLSIRIWILRFNYGLPNFSKEINIQGNIKTFFEDYITKYTFLTLGFIWILGLSGRLNIFVHLCFQCLTNRCEVLKQAFGRYSAINNFRLVDNYFDDFFIRLRNDVIGIDGKVLWNKCVNILLAPLLTLQVIFFLKLLKFTDLQTPMRFV